MDQLDQALGALPRYDASEWAVQEVLRRIDEDQIQTRSRKQRTRWAMVAGGALATAAALLFAIAPPSAPPVQPGGMTMKGMDVQLTPSIELGLSLSRDRVPVALVPGGAARPSDTVLLRYSTDSEGFAYLFRVGSGGDLEVFHGTATLPGTHHFTVDGQMVGYGLQGLRGEHRFGVALSPEPWPPGPDGQATPPAGLAHAARSGSFPRALGGTDVQLDVRSVQVDSGP